MTASETIESVLTYCGCSQRFSEGGVGTLIGCLKRVGPVRRAEATYRGSGAGLPREGGTFARERRPAVDSRAQLTKGPLGVGAALSAEGTRSSR